MYNYKCKKHLKQTGALEGKDRDPNQALFARFAILYRLGHNIKQQWVPKNLLPRW